MAVFRKRIQSEAGDYYGDCVKGDRHRWVPHGKGTVGFSNGNTYTGDWVLCKYQGQGSEYTPATATFGARRYEGGFANSMREGYGKLIIEDLVRDGRVVRHGYSHDGAWSAGKMNGSGVWVSTGRELKYVGKWKNNRYHGSGLLTGSIPDSFSSEFLSPPNQLRGQFAAGHFVQGTITFQNGDTYAGAFGDDEFFDACCTGEGYYTRADGYKYQMVFNADGTLFYHSVD
jgi:hypothetical protein